MRVAVVLLVAGFAPLMCQAAIVPYMQDRFVRAGASGGNAASANQRIDANDFGPFDANVKAQTVPLNELPAGHGIAEASQYSFITSTQIAAEGFASAEGGGLPELQGSGVGESFFTINFDLTQPSQIELFADISGSGFGTFVLIGPDGIFIDGTSLDEPLHVNTTMPVGQYLFGFQLIANSQGASDTVSASLALNAVALPEPGTLWLAAVAALGVGIATRRRR